MSQDSVATQLRDLVKALAKLKADSPVLGVAGPVLDAAVDHLAALAGYSEQMNLNAAAEAIVAAAKAWAMARYDVNSHEEAQGESGSRALQAKFELLEAAEARLAALVSQKQ